MTNDETRRRFEKLLEAKKQASKDQGGAAADKPARTTRQQPAHGGRTFRRKV